QLVRPEYSCQFGRNSLQVNRPWLFLFSEPKSVGRKSFMTYARRSVYQLIYLGIASLCTRNLLIGALAATLGIGHALSAPATNAGCVLIEKEGKVEVARKGSAVWSPAQPNQTLQQGDRLRTGSHSRATLRWAELSVVRVSELTSMEIQPPAKP